MNGMLVHHRVTTTIYTFVLVSTPELERGTVEVKHHVAREHSTMSRARARTCVLTLFNVVGYCVS